jgi:hypothetical protein
VQGALGSLLVQSGTAAADDDLGAERTPPDRRVPERPVFVDASGRRQRRVRRIGWVLVVPAVAYVGMLASTLLGGPTVNSPFLPLPPGPHAPGNGGASGSGAHPGASGGTTAGPGAGATAGAGTMPAGGAGAGGKSGAGGTAPSAAPSALPSVTTSPSAVATHGRSTHTATPPGVSHHPTKKAATP